MIGTATEEWRPSERSSACSASSPSGSSRLVTYELPLEEQSPQGVVLVGPVHLVRGPALLAAASSPALTITRSTRASASQREIETEVAPIAAHASSAASSLRFSRLSTVATAETIVIRACTSRSRRRASPAAGSASERRDLGCRPRHRRAPGRRRRCSRAARARRGSNCVPAVTAQLLLRLRHPSAVR